MKMKKTKTPKADDGALRSAMARLLKTPMPVLRARFQKDTGKDPAGLDRDALVKALATAGPVPDETPSPATAKATRTPRRSTRKRDERLPAPGGKVTKTYKGREYTLEILSAGFRCGGKEYTSPTAAALAITGYKAISGPVFWGFAKPAKPHEAAAPEQPKVEAPKAPAKKKAGRPISAKRR